MKRILVVRTDRVGDVVMITGLLRELRKQFPSSYIGTLTQPNTAQILLHNPNIDIVLTDDLKKGSFIKIVKEIRKHKFTYGLLIMPTERASYQMFIAGIKYRIGVGHKLYEVITFMKSVSRNNYKPLRHEADYDMDLARKIGVVTNNIQPEIFVTKEERTESIQFLGNYGITENDFKIIVHTGSGGSAPNWSENKYFLLIKAILENFDKYNIKIILTAIETSHDFLKKIHALEPKKVINLSDQLGNLRELIKVISWSDIFICSSTGPAHIADALNIKAITLHCNRAMNCATHWGVLNKRSVNLQITDEYCRNHCSADQNECAFENGISVDQVIKNVKYLIKMK